MKVLRRVIAKLSAPLPEVPPRDEENLAQARAAVRESADSLFRAIAHSQAASAETALLREALSRNHLAPSFEMAMRRRGA